MFDWMRRLAKRKSDLATVAAFGKRDLSDLGVSRDQAQTLAAMPAVVPERVRAMGAVFGLSSDDLARDRVEWVQMIETCAQCPSIPQCRQFMRQDGHPSPAGAGFCPNHALFEQHA